MLRLAILCFVGCTALGTGLVTGAWIAQNQPLSVLQLGELAPSAPLFLTSEAYAAPPPSDLFGNISENTSLKLAK